MHYLYYAGMAADRSTEQIGLATSTDGIRFTRVNGSGLIIGRDPGVPWKALRVCNPTVIVLDGRWVMFYQGVGRTGPRGAVTHVLAVARSTDGVEWNCEAQPFLTFDHVRQSCPLFANDESGGVIEPAITCDGARLVMYFVVYRGSYRDGTWLCRASSASDRGPWSIDAQCLLASRAFGDFRLHYPQIVEEAAGLVAWFSLIDRRSQAAAIFTLRLPSVPGAVWDQLDQVLPVSDSPPRVAPQELIALRVNGAPLRGSLRANAFLSQRRFGGRYFFGYSHPHVMESPLGRRLFYHAYHRDTRGQSSIDIGSCGLTADRAGGAHDVALSPAPRPDAWDSYFVGDPFVVER
jgi:predicted GH43/DUF377 family glycosyl hydrolase